MSIETKIAERIKSVTDLWDDPLDEVHDIPPIARAVADLIRAELGADEAVGAVARAMAIHDDYDGCFERVDEWEATPEDERREDEHPSLDYEDCGWWRKRARAALAAVVTALGGDRG